MVVQKDNDEAHYLEWHDKVDKLFELYEQRRKLAASLANAAKPKKEKAQPETEAEDEDDANAD
eukprot:11115317-Alexandrium_andersonii.AAC.1